MKPKSWSGIQLSKSEINGILDKYNVGYLKSFRKLERPEAEAPTNYVLTTSKGKYFLKQYRNSKEIIKGHLRLVEFLTAKNYPCVKVIASKVGKLDTKYLNREFAIFKFVDGKQRYDLTYDEAHELGFALGRLHKLASKFQLSETAVNYGYLSSLLRQNYAKAEKAPERTRKAIAFIKDNLYLVKVPKSLPKSICHAEFTSDHVLYKNGKIAAVIDWDLAGRDYMFYDLGSCLYSAFEDKKGKFYLNTRRMQGILDGYAKVRKLTRWESEHVYESVMFGAFKNAIWSLSLQKPDWNCGEFRIVESLMARGRIAKR